MSKPNPLLGIPWFFDLLRRIIDGGQVAHLRLFLARIAHEAVLDLGCGTGGLSGMTDRKYLGVDVNPGYIEYARRKYGSADRRFLAADAFGLDRGQVGAVDLVSIVNFLHHLSDPDARRLLGRIASLEPRKLFVVDVAAEKGNMATALFRGLDRGAHFRTRTEQRALLESAGYRVLWQDLYWSTSRIYPHSVMLASVPAGAGK